MSVDVIRIVLADSHAVLRVGLESVLNSARDIEVVGQATSGKDAIALAQRLEPQVIVLDVTMPELDAVSATKAIVRAGIATRVLLITSSAEPAYIQSLMDSGAAGWVLNAVAEQELVEAVRAVAKGERWVSPNTTAPAVPEKDPIEIERERYERLTVRERDVLRLVGQGYSAPEIGQRLLISPKTVDTYKQRIQEKLNFSHRSHYVQFALKLGLLAQN